MESAGRRALRHPPSTNTRYSATLYNVEGLEQDMHKPVIVPGMTDMQVKKTEEWMTLVSNSFKQEHKGEWSLDVGNIDPIYKTGTSLRHKRNQQRLHRDWKLN